MKASDAKLLKSLEYQLRVGRTSIKIPDREFADGFRTVNMDTAKKMIRRLKREAAKKTK